MRLIWWGLRVAAAVVVLGTLVPAAASAAFPGRNGLIAVALSSGGDDGILLVSPTGGSAQLVCDQTALCGTPTELRWSPNGDALTFVDTASSRIGAIAPDGTCLWCLLGSPLTTMRGATPAFSSNGQSLTFSSTRRGGIWRAGLTNGSTTAALAGPASDAAWSSRGALAIVRRGAVWVRSASAKRFRKIAIGTEPDWSPDGSKLAIVHRGWIWIVTVKTRAARRRVGGSAPAWSPDGHSIAYIDSIGIVRTIPVKRGRSRSLSIAGRSVDWQALPATQAQTCSLPHGWLITASSAEAVVAENSAGWYGCLRALGGWHLLVKRTSIGQGYITSISVDRLAGRFALIAATHFDQYQNCSEELDRYDVATGIGTALYGSSCDPFPTIGLDVLDSSGFAAWRGTNQIPSSERFQAVSCPAPSICVAVDDVGNVASSADPTGGRSAWQLGNLVGNTPLGSVSCPTVSFCVAGGWGDIYTSADPTGARAGWKAVYADTGSNATAFSPQVSCPSILLCVIADGSGSITTSADPSAASPSWTRQVISGGYTFSALDCPTASLCVALDQQGDIVTSTDPTGAPSHWTAATSVDPGPFGPVAFSDAGISCPSASLCVAVYGDANVLTSTNPAGGRAAWSVAHTSFNGWSTVDGLSAVSCPTTSLCVAADNRGDVVTSTDPTGGASTWHASNVDGTNDITHIACPSATECIAVDAEGNVLSSNDPTGGAVAWSSAPVDVPDCAYLNAGCIVERLYVHDDDGSRIVDAAPPGEGHSITSVSLDPNGLVLSWEHLGALMEARLG